MKKNNSAFTLIELLVVIAIIAILSIIVILVLQPTQLLMQSRDSNRMSDLSIMNTAFSTYIASQGGSGSFSLGSPNVMYISIPDPSATSTAGDQCQGLGLPALPAGDTYFCAASSSYRNVNGTGWLPINLARLSGGSPLGQLPVDPLNQSSTGLFYAYTTNGTQFQVTDLLESQKYKTQYGSSVQDPYYPEVITQGSNLALSLLYNPSGLIGYWPMDEGSGSSTADQSGGGNPGNWVGPSNGNNGTYYTTGKVGGFAGSFDGSSNYAGAVISGNLVNFGDTLTIAAWVKIQGAVSSNGMILGFLGTDPRALLQINSSNQVRIVAAGSNQIAVSTISLDSSWHYIAWTKNGSTNHIYIDGADVTGSVSDATLASANTSFLIGGGALQFFPGFVDDVRIYSRSLSIAEIAAIYNAQR